MTNEQKEYNEAMYNYNIEWMKLMSMMHRAPRCPIWTVTWNNRQWHFTSEEEAWLFAAYWNLI